MRKQWSDHGQWRAGPQARWQHSAEVFLGNSSPGTLRVTNGALVSTGNATLGAQVISQGEASVSGVGSRWNAIGTLDASRLSLGGGTATVVGNGVFDVASVGSVTGTGTGTVLAAVRGDAGSSVSALTGPLTLGNASRNNGFDFGGQLLSFDQQLVLLDSDGARLGTTAQLRDGATLASANGLLLGTGLGSFAGNIVFKGVYAPGGTAEVGFGGGSLSVDTSGVLELGINTLVRRGYTRLTDIGLLNFSGALVLEFRPDMALPAGGTTLSLLDFDSFTGAFDPARISVSGVAVSRLDFSHLGIDRTLRITPVPEPSAAWLMLAGLCTLAGAARRRAVPAAPRRVQPLP